MHVVVVKCQYKLMNGLYHKFHLSSPPKYLSESATKVMVVERVYLILPVLMISRST